MTPPPAICVSLSPRLERLAYDIVISLTIAAVKTDRFSVTVIPETLRATTLAHARVGDRVNIEIDVIVKTVRRYLEPMLPDTSSLTVNKLQQLGF